MTDPTAPGASQPTSARPFIAELQIKGAVQGNRVAGFVAGLLEKVQAAFPAQAVAEVGRLQAEARAVVDAIDLISAQWEATELQVLRDARAARSAELAPSAGEATPEEST